MGYLSSWKGKKVYLSFPTTWKKDEMADEAKCLQVGNGLVSHYHRLYRSLSNYPNCEEVIGKPDLMIIYLREDGWMGKGSSIEFNYAKEHKIPVVFRMEDLATWVDLADATVDYHYKNNVTWAHVWDNVDRPQTLTSVLDKIPVSDTTDEERLSFVQIAKRVTRYNDEDYYY